MINEDSNSESEPEFDQLTDIYSIFSNSLDEQVENCGSNDSVSEYKKMKLQI